MTSSGTVLVWDLRSMEKVQQLSIDSCSNLGYTADKKKLVTVGSSQITVWDSSTFQKEKVLSVPSSVACASIDNGASPSLIVTGGSDNWIRVFDYNTEREVEVIKGHHGPVNCVAFAPDGQTYASGSDDGTVRIWLTKEMAYGLWELGEPASTTHDTPTSRPSTGEVERRGNRRSDNKRSPSRSNSSHKNISFHNNGKSRQGWDISREGSSR
jgi:WD40 repeat protein